MIVLYLNKIKLHYYELTIQQDIYCNLYNRIKDKQEIYSIFDSLESTKNYITEEKQKHKTIEYLIYGKTQEVLYYDTPYTKG